MSLLEEFKAMLAQKPDATDSDVKDYVEDALMVSDSFSGSRRWSENWTAVFRRNSTGPHNSDEYVALDYEVPATELQEGGDFYSAVYAVRPVQVTTTNYEKV